jgi:hypothetical protein
MEALDKALSRAREIYLDDYSGELDAELGKLLPSLIQADYVHEEPWATIQIGFSGALRMRGGRGLTKLEASAKPN